MSEFLAVAVGVVVAAALLFHFSEAIATGLGAVFVAITRWIQKVVFGIDRPVAGAEALIGRRVRVDAEFSPAEDSGLPEGYVIIDGERWRARSANGTQHYSVGETLSVAGREGLVLLVRYPEGK